MDSQIMQKKKEIGLILTTLKYWNCLHDNILN
jgi:hypothetical protein